MIVGGGIAGTALAYLLASTGRLSSPDQVVLLEKESTLGGLCRTDKVGSYMFDRTGHLLHFSRPWTRGWFESLATLEHHVRKAIVLLEGRLIPYPLQTHLAYAPAHVVEDCLVGLAERRPPKDDSFLERQRAVLGDGIVDCFLEPYNTKLTGVPSSQLASDWAGRFFPKCDARAVVRGALDRNPQSRGGYNDDFAYPIDGIGALCGRMGQAVQQSVTVRTAAEVVEIDTPKKLLRLASGQTVAYDALVLTLPLKQAVALTRDVPAEVVLHADRLRCASVYNVNLGLAVPAPKNIHWVYIPDRRMACYRFGVNSSFCSKAAPSGHCAVYAEASYLGKNAPMREEAMVAEVLRIMPQLGIECSRNDVREVCAFDMKHAYVVFDSHRGESRARVMSFYEDRGIHLLGRYGRWEYSSMEEAVVDARQLAMKLLGTETPA